MRSWKPTKAYWRNYNALYGEQAELSELAQPKSKAAPKRTCPIEQDEQFAAHAWLLKMNIRHNHSPNGGYRDIREAAKFKRMGVSAGFPDFEIPYARKGYHGLYIELKRLFGGKLSEYQVWWRDHFLAEGYAWHEAKGAQELILLVKNYFDMV